ncbi:copper amine oxidase N-terminal domain-containing protein [Anaerosolibacter sp.]|uniref:copper amine oxidase N-terminal domain-containing protein n=1 Tax=Anaerosolibacter sp. TaxID=1872527 RepID=UPI0039EE0852
MKKFIAGLLSGMIIASLSFSFADSSIIKLIINGEDITSSAQPTIIDGRTLVPARALAEKLGAKVEWDEKNRAVIVTSVVENTPTDLPSVSTINNNINIIAPTTSDNKQLEELENNKLNGWYTSREIVEKYGATIGAEDNEGKMFIEGKKYISFYIPVKSGEFKIETEYGTVTFKMENNRLYIKESELLAAGIV